MYPLRGIRGATTLAADEKDAVFASVRELLSEILRQNKLSTEQIGAAIFSATEDITAAFPAAAARSLPGWDLVPLFDTRQMAVNESLKRCVRVLLLVDLDLPQAKIHHVYLHGANKLRPDLAAD